MRSSPAEQSSAQKKNPALLIHTANLLICKISQGILKENI